jgi:Arc/MetJ family transcription regulator
MMQNKEMRVTVDIEEATLERVMAITGEKNKSPAIAKAVEEFVRRTMAKEFAARIREGVFDYPLSDAELKGLDC